MIQHVSGGKILIQLLVISANNVTIIIELMNDDDDDDDDCQVTEDDDESSVSSGAGGDQETSDMATDDSGIDSITVSPSVEEEGVLQTLLDMEQDQGKTLQRSIVLSLTQCHDRKQKECEEELPAPRQLCRVVAWDRGETAAER